MLVSELMLTDVNGVDVKFRRSRVFFLGYLTVEKES